MLAFGAVQSQKQCLSRRDVAACGEDLERMRSKPTKNYPTIGCCGIDCGLCPRYHTDGKSKCPGCAGKDFYEKHPSCSIVTCCLMTKQLETCGSCEEFICKRIRNWDSADSFVTHRNCICNLKSIREHGLDAFIEQQEDRLQLLKTLLEEFDDGRSKSFYCLSAALLPIGELRSVMEKVRKVVALENDRKHMAKSLREAFAGIAKRSSVELSYRKKT